MPSPRRAVLLSCSLAISAVAVAAQPTPPAAPPAAPAAAPPAAIALTAEQWRADLEFLAGTLPERHPRPFARITRGQWLTAVAELDAKIPSLWPDEIAVGFARLVAMIGDAHTVAHAANVPPGFRSLPMRLYWFADGLYVAAVAKGRESLLGLRLTRIGSTPLDSAATIVARTFVDENEALHKMGVAQALTTVEVLHALHLIEDASRAALGFAGPSGAVEDTLAPIEDAGGAEWVRWPDVTGAPTPLARSRPQSWFWSQRDEASGLYFIQYNRCQDSPDLRVSDFITQVLGEIDARPPRAVVVDLRYNGGGSSRLLTPLIKALARRRGLDAADRLFVLVGRQTFSSALMNAVQFRQLTKATLVGEPTGGKPNHFGEIRSFTLPNSRMSIQHSTKYFREQARDEDTLHPDVRVDVNAADYAAGRDPVMEEVMRRIGAGR